MFLENCQTSVRSLRTSCAHTHATRRSTPDVVFVIMCGMSCVILADDVMLMAYCFLRQGANKI